MHEGVADTTSRNAKAFHDEQRNPRVGIVVDDLASIDHLLRVCSKCVGTPK
jgi:polysaccharide deacetylase 2 family uncharacterized protein YibQ